MSLQNTPSSERVHIAFFGRRNAGKSSLVNAVTGQNLSVVSDVAGTTTDPVQKTMELLPLGPVVIIDTPGFDDEGALGEERVKRTRRILSKTDIAVLVVDASASNPMGETEKELLSLFQKMEIPYVVAGNKRDLLEADSVEEAAQADEAAVARTAEGPARTGEAVSIEKAAQATQQEASGEKYLGEWLLTSATAGEGIEELKEKLAHLMKDKSSEKRIIGDLLAPGDFVILVVPIDKAAPKGRLILPQQLTLRDCLDAGACPLVTGVEQLSGLLDSLTVSPRLVITDSQVFGEVEALLPKELPLTSFSILMARYKGELAQLMDGTKVLSQLQDGDAVLISEGCTHHRQCDDIGSVKLPRMLAAFTGKQLEIHLSSGTEFTEEPEKYKLMIHCGGCMLSEREMKARQALAREAGIPMTNYGMAIAAMKGILERSLKSIL